MKNTLTESTAFRTSLQVAEEFGKRHAQVLKDIRELECSQDFHSLNFQETSYRDKKCRKQPMFLMTQDGYAFLSRSYVHKKVVRTKEAIIINEEIRKLYEAIINNGKIR